MINNSQSGLSQFRKSKNEHGDFSAYQFGGLPGNQLESSEMGQTTYPNIGPTDKKTHNMFMQQTFNQYVQQAGDPVPKRRSSVISQGVIQVPSNFVPGMMQG